MHQYEIRFLRKDRSTQTVLEVLHLNDHAAIRQAKKLAEGQPFEVWRELDCVYGEITPTLRRSGQRSDPTLIRSEGV